MKESISLLMPFEVATIDLSSEQYVSVSKILPIARLLQEAVAKNSSKPALASCLEREMNSRFVKMEDNKMLAIATLLDPRFKTLPFANAEGVAQKVVAEMAIVPDMTNTGSSRQDLDDLRVQETERCVLWSSLTNGQRKIRQQLWQEGRQSSPQN